MIGKVFAFIAGFLAGTIFGAFVIDMIWEWLKGGAI